jgi:NADH-quinone oxidoreductase subunit L
MEKEGKPVHEASRLMLLPYLALAGVTLLLGFTGPFFEGFLDFSFASHLEQGFGMVVIEAPFSINPVALAASLGALAVGGFFGYSFYIGRRFDPGKVLASSGFVRSIHAFLENRWYINSIYYIVFVNGSLRVATFLHKWVEIAILNRINSSVTNSTQYFSSISGKFDRYVVDGVVTGIASISLFLSKLLTKIQTGVTEQYVFGFSTGIIFLVILMSILL